MGSFWGQRKNDSDRPEGTSHRDENDDEYEPSLHQQPTERTTLLPRNNSQEYLSPDDPAVSWFVI